MRNRRSVYTCARAAVCALLLTPAVAAAADIYVPAGGDLQSAIDSAQAGDTILLEAGATFVGNFKLPVHAGTTYITIRSAASDTVLPPAGTRITPAYGAYLPKIKSPNTDAAMRTKVSAAYWRLMDLEFLPSDQGYDILDIGDGSSTQNDLSLVPYHFIVDRVYLHGDPVNGQKRGIGLNAGDVTISNSYVSDIKAIGQDSQAIGGWNGPGPYRILNNYLEGAGENVLFGGDDPKIPNLTPTDIVIRGNTIRKPTTWRNPIVPTPANVRPSVSTGGSLPAGTYAYRVMARQVVSGSTAKSLPSAEVSVTAGAGASVSLTWDAIAGASDYVVFGRTAGTENMYWIVSSPAFTDAGAAGTSGTPSTTATMWQVKNLLELKNAHDVQIDHNVIENNWTQAQDGMAVLFTPRNQYGGCTWCGVQNVTFEHNVLRHSVGAISILGYDNEHPSQQTRHIIVRNNELSDLSKSWGASGYPFLLMGGPADLTFDHNTVISTNSGLLEVSGPVVYGLVFTNNVARHNAYGIFGNNYGYGTAAINYYFPDGIVVDNVLAGGSAKYYPSGNLFPTVTDFEAHFVDYANGVYALNAGTDWAGAGTDGLDLGAAQPVLDTVSAQGPAALQLTTTSLPSTTQNDAYSAALQASGGVLPYSWSIPAGALPPGLALDTAAGTIAGQSTTAGDYAFTAQVMDATGLNAMQSLSIHVAAYVAPVAILTTSLPNATATVPYTQSLVATGGSGAYVWALSGGSLPVGLQLDAAGVLSGTTSQQGTFAFSVTVQDANDTTRVASGSFTLGVAPPPNVPPAVSISAPTAGAVFRTGATITLAAQASDVDGTVQRVDFYAGSALVGSSAGPVFSAAWQIPSSGDFSITAIAVDSSGASASSAAVTISAQAEAVIYASQATAMAGNYSLVADASAAGGFALLNTNQGAAKAASASASPASYAEFTFYAEAGRAYHLWIRGYAQRNDPYNDSAFVQFDGVADARIGTTSSRIVNLEDCSGCGLSGWGWQDDGWGVGVLGAPIYFERTGVQRIRIQPREDGFAIDQIVLSPEKYLATAPGALKNDTTILQGASNQGLSMTSPYTWTSTDVGSVAAAGSASVTGGVFTVAGSGADIWGSADAFQFYYQPLTGDGAIVARVASLQNIDRWTKAAVMMRDTTAAGSAHAMMLVSPGKGTAFQRRTVAGGLSANTYGPLAAAPYWVKLVRAGTTVTAYASPDGATWTLVGSDTIALGTTIDVGLAVSSHVDGTLATATFDNVAITQAP